MRRIYSIEITDLTEKICELIRFQLKKKNEKRKRVKKFCIKSKSVIVLRIRVVIQNHRSSINEENEPKKRKNDFG